MNRYMVGRVHIVSSAFRPIFHRCTMETIIHLDAHAQSTRRSQERERQPISTLVSSSVQPPAISLALSALTTHFDNAPPHYHTTMKARPSHDFRIFAMNNNMIQFQCGSNPPLEVDWLDAHQMCIQMNAH